VIEIQQKNYTLLGINPADPYPVGPPDRKEKIIDFNIYLQINEEFTFNGISLSRTRPRMTI
jgi:hypothetical protein